MWITPSVMVSPIITQIYGRPLFISTLGVVETVAVGLPVPGVQPLGLHHDLLLALDAHHRIIKAIPKALDLDEREIMAEVRPARVIDYRLQFVKVLSLAFLEFFQFVVDYLELVFELLRETLGGFLGEGQGEGRFGVC